MEEDEAAASSNRVTDKTCRTPRLSPFRLCHPVPVSPTPSRTGRNPRGLRAGHHGTARLSNAPPSDRAAPPEAQLASRSRMACIDRLLRAWRSSAAFTCAGPRGEQGVPTQSWLTAAFPMDSPYRSCKRTSPSLGGKRALDTRRAAAADQRADHASRARDKKSGGSSSRVSAGGPDSCRSRRVQLCMPAGRRRRRRRTSGSAVWSV